eukprot:COSAG04_NODE_991_length_8915_cov_4.477654_7_plen_235_part_00
MERRPASEPPRVPMDPAAMLDRLANPSVGLSEEDLQLLLAVLHATLGVLEGGSRKRKQQVVLGAVVLSLMEQTGGGDEVLDRVCQQRLAQHLHSWMLDNPIHVGRGYSEFPRAPIRVSDYQDRYPGEITWPNPQHLLAPVSLPRHETPHVAAMWCWQVWHYLIGRRTVAFRNTPARRPCTPPGAPCAKRRPRLCGACAVVPRPRRHPSSARIIGPANRGLARGEAISRSPRSAT